VSEKINEGWVGEKVFVGSEIPSKQMQKAKKKKK
jgi:hypothetical protein